MSYLSNVNRTVNNSIFSCYEGLSNICNMACCIGSFQSYFPSSLSSAPLFTSAEVTILRLCQSFSVIVQCWDISCFLIFLALIVLHILTSLKYWPNRCYRSIDRVNRRIIVMVESFISEAHTSEKN